MSLHKATEGKLDEAYRAFKYYFNEPDDCEELHLMCENCEKFNGINEHDYSECKDLICFRNWLGLAYLNWITEYE